MSRAETETADTTLPVQLMDDETERCFACGVAFKLGDMVIEDINEGTMHRDCAGPEREGFVDPETEEPIGPDEPIPTGYPWHPDPATPTGSVGDGGLREVITDHGEAGASIALRVVQRVCDFDDRTSPDDQPDMMLVTGQELTDLIEEEVSRYWSEPALAPQPPKAEMPRTITTHVLVDFNTRRLVDIAAKAEAGGVLDEGEMCFLIRLARQRMDDLAEQAAP